MIKKRLVQLLSHAKKYIVGQVLCQWLALWCQVATIWAAAGLLNAALFGGLEQSMLLSRGLVVFLAVALKFVLDRLSSKMSYLASASCGRRSMTSSCAWVRATGRACPPRS